METLSISPNVKTEKVQPLTPCNQFFLNGAQYNVIKSSEVSKILKELTECVSQDKEIQACQKLNFEESFKRNTSVGSSSQFSSRQSSEICKSDSSSSEFSILTFPSTMDSIKIEETNTKKFTCETCGKNFSKRDFLQKHKVVHEAPKHRCVLCDKCFMREDKLKRHFLSIHSKYRPHVCQICSKAFARKDKLKDHQRHHLTAGDNFKCFECNIAFVQKSDLNRHGRLLHGGKPVDEKKKLRKPTKPSTTPLTPDSDAMKNLSGVISAVMESTAKMASSLSSTKSSSDTNMTDSTINASSLTSDTQLTTFKTSPSKLKSTSFKKKAMKNSNKPSDNLVNFSKTLPIHNVKLEPEITNDNSMKTTNSNCQNSTINLVNVSNDSSNLTTSNLTNNITNFYQANIQNINNFPNTTINNTNNTINFPFSSCFPNYNQNNSNVTTDSSINSNKPASYNLTSNIFSHIKPESNLANGNITDSNGSSTTTTAITSNNANNASSSIANSAANNFRLGSISKEKSADIVKKESFETQLSQSSLSSSSTIHVAARAVAAAASFMNNTAVSGNSPFPTNFPHGVIPSPQQYSAALSLQNNHHNPQSHPPTPHHPPDSSYIQYSPYTNSYTQNNSFMTAATNTPAHLLNIQHQQYLSRSMMFGNNKLPINYTNNTAPTNNNQQVPLFYPPTPTQPAQPQQQPQINQQTTNSNSTSFQQPLMSALNCTFPIQSQIPQQTSQPLPIHNNFSGYNGLLGVSGNNMLKTSINSTTNNTTTTNSNNGINSISNYPYIPF